MKKILFFIALSLGLVIQITAQNLGQDFVIIDQSAPNLESLKSEFAGKTNMFLNDNSKPAPYIISAMLENKTIVDLHLYVSAQSGSLLFNSGAVTSANASSYSQFFANWKNNISGKVIIHNSEIFTTPAGTDLEINLEELTGLEFIMQ